MKSDFMVKNLHSVNHENKYYFLYCPSITYSSVNLMFLTYRTRIVKSLFNYPRPID